MSTPPPLSPDARPRTPLLIVHIGPPEALDRAPAIYRTVQPCRALGELPDVTVVSGSIFSPQLYAGAGGGGEGLLLAADLLVIRDVADPDLLPVVAARRRNGRLTAYEIGNPIFARPADGAAAADDLVARSLPPQLARQADCLQLASAALDVRFAALNPRRAVFPSQLWNAPASRTPRAAAAQAPVQAPVMGWLGTRAERNDLALALPAIRGVLDRHPALRFAVMGDPEVQEMLAALPAGRVSFTPAGSLESAYKFLEQIDIGLQPLQPTAENRGRDDVRFLEFAAHGVLAVCADLEPYRDVVRPGQTGFLFRDAAELETVLERALAEAEVRAAIPARAARVAAERLERPHALHRLGFYLSVAAQLGIRLDGGERARVPLPDLGEGDHARGFPDARYVALGAGSLERLLAEGWTARVAGHADEACGAFTEAERLSPASHLPPLLLGMTTPDDGAAAAALLRAEERNPLSCHAPYLRGVRLLARGDEPAASAAFERARAIAPGFGAPQERLGALAEAAGRVGEAARYYEEAALQNGAFALPIARLAQFARREGRLDKAVALLERSLGDDPGLGLTNLLVGRAYFELKRFHQARVHLERALSWAEAGAGPLDPTYAPLLEGGADRAVLAAELARATAAMTK
ncbi:MAG TPA: glycosyltransferase [Polyangia bacterium]|nr:glycosyltransferase [Polyangia bacterium]